MSSVMPTAPQPMTRPSARPWSAKDAKAQAKAHAARIKALRPWYQKKRYLLLIAIIAIVGFAFVNSKDSKTDDLEPGQSANITSLPITNDVPTDAIVKIKTISRLATT
jgi:hypothetical protein